MIGTALACLFWAPIRWRFIGDVATRAGGGVGDCFVCGNWSNGAKGHVIVFIGITIVNNGGIGILCDCMGSGLDWGSTDDCILFCCRSKSVTRVVALLKEFGLDIITNSGRGTLVSSSRPLFQESTNRRS